jgi:hypothetical protein
MKNGLFQLLFITILTCLLSACVATHNVDYTTTPETLAVKDKIFIVPEDMGCYSYGEKRSIISAGEEMKILFSKPCHSNKQEECWAIYNEKHGKCFVQAHPDWIKE